MPKVMIALRLQLPTTRLTGIVRHLRLPLAVAERVVAAGGIANGGHGDARAKVVLRRGIHASHNCSRASLKTIPDTRAIKETIAFLPAWKTFPAVVNH